jgi:hypothetical protein
MRARTHTHTHVHTHTHTHTCTHTLARVLLRGKKILRRSLSLSNVCVCVCVCVFVHATDRQRGRHRSSVYEVLVRIITLLVLSITLLTASEGATAHLRVFPIHEVNRLLFDRPGREEVCVCFITAGPITKLFACGGEESGGHVLWETTSRGLCG